ncbi:hypothetical protein NIBR502774_14315 (plasmid) [Rhizobium sp. NIBRBAC000502774]|nr:hypothetical protein NIBR502774_14315 [Rhizobium sp. NIBRBAC000502774]
MMRAIIAILFVAWSIPPAVAGEVEPAPLAPYVGHLPFEPVGGVKFLEHPLVRAAVQRAVRDPKVRKWLLIAGTSPSPPIFLKDGAIVSTGCQWHGCEQRNWAILIDPAGKTAQVCYFNGSGAGPRWYAGDGSSAIREEECPSRQ